MIIRFGLFILVFSIFSSKIFGEDITTTTGTSIHTSNSQSDNAVDNLIVNQFQSEENTLLDRVMSKWIGSFLIVGMVIGILLIFVVFIGGIEGSIRTFSCLFLTFYCYLLLNYAIWFFSHSDRMTKIGFVSSGLVFLLVPIAKVCITVKKKGQEILVSRTDWTCSQCQTKNRFSVKCWNCNTPKV